MALFNPVLSNPFLFSIPYTYKSKTSELSSSLSISFPSSPSYFSLIPSQSPSPPLSPLVIFILQSQTCPLPPLHIHKHFFFPPTSPAILWHSYPLISYLPGPPFTPTHYLILLLPSSHLIPFVSSPTGSFSPQFALPSCLPCPLHPSQILEGALFIATEAVQ